jgi:hypothetical protein
LSLPSVAVAEPLKRAPSITVLLVVESLADDAAVSPVPDAGAKTPEGDGIVEYRGTCTFKR